MFLHLSAILFSGGWLPSMHHGSHDQGVCLGGVYIDGVGTPLSSTTGYVQQAGSTHPTGMHSCFYLSMSSEVELE